LRLTIQKKIKNKQLQTKVCWIHLPDEALMPSYSYRYLYMSIPLSSRLRRQKFGFQTETILKASSSIIFKKNKQRLRTILNTGCLKSIFQLRDRDFNGSRPMTLT